MSNDYGFEDEDKDDFAEPEDNGPSDDEIDEIEIDRQIERDEEDKIERRIEEDEIEKAWLVVYDEDKEPVWIPKSQGQINYGTLTIPEWLANDKGMI